MHFWASQYTDNAMGAGLFSYATSYVAADGLDFGSAIDDLCVEASAPIGRSSRALNTNFKAPHVTFRRKAKAFKVNWIAQHVTPREMKKISGLNITQDVLRRAMRDIIAALEWGFQERLKASDDFDAVGCLDYLRGQLDFAYPTERAFRAELLDRDARHRNFWINAEFRRKIDIDWDALHPNAAALLAHPDLWSSVDERMPQGSLRGQGILRHYDDYAGRDLTDILATFGLKDYDVATTREDQIAALQVEMALVFAAIKKTGTVDQAQVDAMLDRVAVEAAVPNSFWLHRSKYGLNTHFHWMFQYLEPFSRHSHPPF